ncbi:VanZ family protein [uncultured Muriicola sp.]|uniref:VanZ family protein n=1 Tax=uncultured Muriicola sp. TaxID=1583102 RepID=UPI0026187F8A|nr:VanZ family protein [uncultured Muriicola sp.]
MLKQIRYRIGFISWMVFITVMSLVSFEDNNSLDINIPYFDKLVHFTFYFIASMLGGLFGREISKGHIAKAKVLGISFVGLVLYGIIIEVIQSYMTTYRSGELMDVMANSTGTLLGTLLIMGVFSKRSGLKWEN